MVGTHSNSGNQKSDHQSFKVSTESCQKESERGKDKPKTDYLPTGEAIGKMPKNQWENGDG